jgi:hypothetical protein
MQFCNSPIFRTGYSILRFFILSLLNPLQTWLCESPNRAPGKAVWRIAELHTRYRLFGASSISMLHETHCTITSLRIAKSQCLAPQRIHQCLLKRDSISIQVFGSSATDEGSFSQAISNRCCLPVISIFPIFCEPSTVYPISSCIR